MIDYHTHTPRCGHAKGPSEAYIQTAVEKGFKQIGISDHHPMFHMVDPTLTMDFDVLPDYIEETLSFKQKYEGTIEVLLGVEADYIPGYEPQLEECLARHPYDYVIGSVHFMGEWGFDDPRHCREFERRDIDEAYREYFRLIEASARCGLFDMLAHIDLVKKFGHRPTRPVLDLAGDALDAIAEAGIAIEFSSAGLRKPVGEIYPSLDIARAAVGRGIPITLSSDAHVPRDVGRDYDALYKLLADCGVRKVVGFRNRRQVEIPLDEVSIASSFKSQS